MKIDLHVHASERSGCSTSGEKEILRAARGFGLDALAFTDHDRLAGEARLTELNRKFAPFRIFCGVEVRTLEEEDVLVLGLDEPDLESLGWHYDDLHVFVRERNGFFVLAHPFRFHDGVSADVELHCPDAVEVASTNMAPEVQAKARDFAARLGCPTIHASDAHQADRVGIYYVDVDGSPETDADLVRLLRERAFTCGIMTDRLAGPGEPQG